MRSGMKWWTEKKIEWYRRASEESLCHRQLASALERHLIKELNILELGCGLGYEAEILVDDGYMIKAADTDEIVLQEAYRRSGKNIYINLDAYGPLPYPDQILMISFGHLDLPDSVRHFLSYTKRIVTAVPHHNSQGFQTRENKISRILKAIDEAGAEYEEEIIVLDFSQPLLSLSDAEEYISACYPEEHKERLLKLVEENDGKYPYILRNRKEFSILTITSEE